MKRGRILLVEDSLLIATEVARSLEALGFEVVGPFGRIAPAHQAAAREPLDAALLDLELAGEAVYPVAEQLRERGVPILFMSGHDESALPQTWRCCVLLNKPFGRADLDQALTRARASTLVTVRLPDGSTHSAR